jgi:hypothetical protein
MPERFRQLEEAQSKIAVLLEQLPAEQRACAKEMVKEFQNKQLPKSQVENLTSRLVSLERLRRPRTIQDQIWAIMMDYDRLSEIFE